MQLSVFTATTGAASVIQNAAAARIQGLEVEAVLRPLDSLTVNASPALPDPEYKRFIDGGIDVSDNRAFPHAPETTASIGADWRAAEGDWGRLNIYADLNYSSEYFTFPYARARRTHRIRSPRQASRRDAPLSTCGQLWRSSRLAGSMPICRCSCATSPRKMHLRTSSISGRASGHPIGLLS